MRARNWDALCLYGWHHYMYNPQLKRWLARIAVPTLVLWGASDGIVTPEYGRAYAGLIPGARFALIEQAGHHPEIEQPEALRPSRAGILATAEGVARDGRLVAVRNPLSLRAAGCAGRGGFRARQPAEQLVRSDGSPPICSRRCSTSSCCATTKA